MLRILNSLSIGNGENSRSNRKWLGSGSKPLAVCLERGLSPIFNFNDSSSNDSTKKEANQPTPRTTQRNNSTADAAAMPARANSSQTERKKRHVIKKDELLAAMTLLRSGLFMKKTEYRKTTGLPLIADLLGLGRSGLKKAVAREDPALAEQIAGSESAEEGLVPMLVTQADENTEQVAPRVMAAGRVRVPAPERALEIEEKGGEPEIDFGYEQSPERAPTHNTLSERTPPPHNPPP